MAACRALGARRIIGVDVQPERLDFAKSYAAADIFLPSKKNEGETNAAYSKRNAAEMMENLGIPDRGLEGIDLILECSGAEVGFVVALRYIPVD
jgi:D-xylulose reductase